MMVMIMAMVISIEPTIQEECHVEFRGFVK